MPYKETVPKFRFLRLNGKWFNKWKSKLLGFVESSVFCLASCSLFTRHAKCKQMAEVIHLASVTDVYRRDGNSGNLVTRQMRLMWCPIDFSLFSILPSHSFGLN
ncbi:hypothetical protein CEXT_652771 [Caerostris extrusa]|uniref:Uncharacterized protein n=1 Tax=Caerostris extrusa TaxID=172846 RepID=A0AAV4M3W1_CAEEX|nr:hypothetical protein CEXT_652771 [Caerostris extrusa]